MIKFRIPDWNAVVDEVADEMLARIVRRTPVATGKARAGWEVTGPSGDKTISNDVPYIGVLEYGSSDKAPNGMVRVTLEEVKPMLEKQIDAQMK